MSDTPKDPTKMQTFGPLKDTNPKDAIGVRKAPLSCVPMNVVAELGVAMLEGAAKYGRHNYRASGVRASVYFDAIMRHLIAHWEGETIDPDSGLPHLTKAMAAMAVWRDAQLNGMEDDDRPPASAAFYDELHKRSADILDRHAGKAPTHYTNKPQKAEARWVDLPLGAETTPNGTITRVRMRNGVEYPNAGRSWRWYHLGADSDIVAYEVQE